MSHKPFATMPKMRGPGRGMAGSQPAPDVDDEEDGPVSICFHLCTEVKLSTILLCTQKDMLSF